MGMKRYLFWCVNEHIEFRIPELKSVASLFQIPIKWIEKPKEDPYLLLELNNENEARQIASRCMLVRACYELWGDGKSQNDLHKNIKEQPSSLIKPYIAKDKSFRIRVESFNRTLKTAEKLAKIESLNYLPFEGPVDLMNPITKLCLLEYYGLKNNDVPEEPYRVFMGRCIAFGGREHIAQYSLKQRRYIGSTSMDPQLAFIMTNMAGVKEADLVLDPFVGTGSILVSAAHHGAYVWGSDIDFLTLHARTKPTRYNQQERDPNESIRANLEQYGLESQYIDVVVVDCARSSWTQKSFLDAIITDPPYGIRESTARVGKESGPDGHMSVQQKKKRRKERQQFLGKSVVNSNNTGQHITSPNSEVEDGVNISCDVLDVQNNENTTASVDPSRKDNTQEDGSQGPHYPSKVQYSIYSVFKDLLNFAASALVIGGKLVFWLPVIRDEYTSSTVPSHPCLKLEYNCEQVLNAHTSRRLITLSKTRQPEAGEEAIIDTRDLLTEFREKFFIASQMTREERVARKCMYPRDKRGQGLAFRVTDDKKRQESRDLVENGILESSLQDR